MDFAAQLALLDRKATQAARRPANADARPVQRRRYNHSESTTRELERRGYRIIQPEKDDWQPKSDRSRPHICLLAITIQDMPWEDIWRAWAASSNTQCTVSLVAHAKFPHQVQSAWLQQRLLRKDSNDDFLSFCPEWGSVQITRAMIECLRVALRIGTTDEEWSRRYQISPQTAAEAADAPPVSTVDKFLFISESCVPVVSLDEAVQAMFFHPTPSLQSPTEEEEATVTSTIDAWDISWVNYRNCQMPGTPANMYERDQFRRIHPMIPELLRTKADQWLLLSRRHAEAVDRIDAHLPEQHLWRTAFVRVSASDELYFPTALALVGVLRADTSTTTTTAAAVVQRRPVTYTDWSEGQRNPVSFGAAQWPALAAAARARGCLVARKLVPTTATGDPLSVEAWSRHASPSPIQEQQPEEEAASRKAATDDSKAPSATDP